MLVASVDVGVVNLGVVFAELDDDTYLLTHVHRCENLDTRRMEHGRVSCETCTLGHTKTATDRLNHFMQERRDWFDRCAHVLIERQPIMGHTDVEQLLYSAFRDKAVLVSPNSMHKYFNIRHFTYDGRKEMTVRIADDLLPVTHFPRYHEMERKHDIADAVCIMLFWISQQHTRVAAEAEKERRRREIAEAPAVSDVGSLWDKYRYRAK
jgi:hypothetical protein